MSNLSGQSIGRYHIIEPLGEGGMATVYKAFDTRLETDVAIKVIRTDRFTPEMLTEALKRFEREAKSLARLTHPNIVKVTDYGEHEGQPYLVMVYLPGGTLKDRLGKPMPWSEAARILIPVARALEFAHQRNIVHRDIKPSNILITESGEPMLSDFGVAKIISDESTTGLTGTGIAVGTPEYMAPEQVNAKTADGRADIYALGIVFYEMVTGRRPFQADTPLAVLFKHLTDPLPRPTEFVPDLPDAVEKVLFKALAKKPEDRYQTMGEFAAALEKLTAIEQPAVTGKKQEVKRESPEKANAPVVPTVFAPPPASPKVETKKVDLGEARLHTPTKQEKPVETKKPARPARSFKLLIPIGIVVVVLGIGIPLGVHFLKPSEENQDPSAGSPTNTAAFTPLPIFTPTLKPIPTESSIPGETSTPKLAPVLTINVPNPKIGSSWTRPADGMTMVYVPEGEFMMGSNGGAVDERPIHIVYLNAFWIDQTEVTNAMYAKCVAAGKCNPPSDRKSYTRQDYYGNWKYDDYPVIHVSWNDAAAYCQWLGAGLPTEAEWEKAARGADGRDYPWGAQIDCQKANYYGCVGDTDRAGSYEIGKSPFGATNMAGNVWEWVADWYGDTYYSSSPQNNPLGPTSGTVRVLRGGSWNLKDTSLRSASRSWRNPLLPSNDIGFRCARPIESTAAVVNTPAPTTTTTLNIGSTWTRPADGMVMVYVPEGEFTMGSDGGKSDEKPAHIVYLDAFWIDQTEVTNKMYALCVAVGKCEPPDYNKSYSRSSYFGNPEYDDYPVIYASWQGASAYCAWAGARLPTEAEWEKAARGADGRIYPWGAQIDCQKANYRGCDSDTSRVGSYESGKSPYGAYDMAGNASEWVADWYNEIYYSYSPANNPTGPSSGDEKVLRGGSWYDFSLPFSFARGRYNPLAGSSYYNGFRCARSVK